MRVLRSVQGVAASVLLCCGSAMAGSLSIATVTPTGVSCVFTPTCKVRVTDTTGYFQLFGNAGHGKLLVRTYAGLPGTRAAGLTGYSLFLDMKGATALGTPNCVAKLTLETGPLASVAYTNAPADVFVVYAQGGVAVSSAVESRGKVTFTFAKPICPAPGRLTESLYFGFAAKGAPVAAKAEVTGTFSGKPVLVDARVPAH